MQVARTLEKRSRFIPEDMTVKPGARMQVVIQNSGFEAQTFASDNMGFGELVIPARSSGSIEWQAPDIAGEYTLTCTDCKLSGETYTLRVSGD